MKQFIIMSLTLIAFSLISCGKSEKEKCEEKDGKVWKDSKCADETPDPAPAAATYTTKETCEAADHLWDASADPKCKPKPAAQKTAAEMTKAECDASANHTWDANVAPAVCKEKEEATPPAVVKYTITNIHTEVATVASGTTLSSSLAQNACATVTAEQWAELKVSVGENVVCDNTDNTGNSANNDNNCIVPSAEILNKDLKEKTGDDGGYELADRVTPPANCSALSSVVAGP